MAFASIAGLNIEQHAVFQNLPPPGSSIVFELFSLQSSNVGTYVRVRTSFPSRSAVH